jgi:2',3'-cyclic-nucleotide 2'-phosphodiesterase (5'-nucleotidase family)
MNGPYPEIITPSHPSYPVDTYSVRPSAMHISNLALIKLMKVLKNNLAKNDIFVISGYGPFVTIEGQLLSVRTVIDMLHFLNQLIVYTI